MKKVAVFLLLLPLVSIAQSSYDFSATQSADHSGVIWAAVIAYTLASIIVAYNADRRGWDGLGAFCVCIFTTPLIGAVLFSPINTKKEKEATASAVEGKKVPDTVNN